jgi:hypothetical protein
MNKILAFICIGILTLTAGCGGGGGAAPIPATLKLSSSGTLPAGATITGYDITLELPAGVSVKTTAGGAVDAGVVVPSGLLAGTTGTIPVNYTPASGTIPATLDFTVISGVAAGVGEFATINVNLSSASTTAAGFNVTRFKAYDQNYAALDAVELVKTLSLR